MASKLNSPKPIIGVVGGIGAGKSTIAQYLVEFGGKVVAGDPLGHEALEQPEILAEIAKHWGQRGVLTSEGKVDRKALGRIVFPSPVERARLEHIVHPYIEKRIHEEVLKAAYDPATKFVVLDAAIMLEAGWNNVCDKLIYVHADREVRLDRVKKARGWTEADLINREAVQMPPELKQQQADATILNNGPQDQVPAQVEALLKDWKLA
ncbi:MAG: dephospho-CoA kinase [Gemmataceae bacterium]|jgi:dephospho-CoA kinase|nr:dephospho-CoA kinase [Gemmataceae bacterium]